MIHFERSLMIDARAHAIWNVLGKFMQIDEFAPLLKSVDALTEGPDGVGSKRRCHFEDGNSVVEEVTEWETNHRYRVRLLEAPSMPLHEAYAEICIKPHTQGRSLVVWSMDYRMKYGPLGWLMGQTLLKMMMGKVLDANLKGLSAKVKAPRAIAA
ncbi:SRPBCC family protein [Pseudovibrio sp. SCP19]|uniref:SRPBCC family protein n=1 Tax=Pseudovibrio sp. SCP19 TaxID=3141374 RepID=UPI003335D044